MLIKRLLITAKALISLSLLTYLLWQLDWQALTETANNLQWWTLPAAVIILLSTLYFGTLRWALLLRTHYDYFKLPQLFKHYLVGTLFNNLLPTSTGGDLVRSYYIYRHNRDAVCAVSPVITERVVGLIVLLAISVLAIFLTGSTAILGATTWSTLLIILSCSLVGMLLITLPATYWPLHRLLERLSRFRIIALLLRMGEATHGYFRKPALMLMLMTYSFIGQLLAVVTYYVIASGLNIEISMQTLLVVIPIALMAAALPISLGGMGVRELATAGLLIRFGVSETDAAAVALFFIPVLLITSLPGLYIFLTESGSKHLLRDAEKSRIG
jgi:uncharacterized protein (TIRG00374 family)